MLIKILLDSHHLFLSSERCHNTSVKIVYRGGCGCYIIHFEYEKEILMQIHKFCIIYTWMRWLLHPDVALKLFEDHPTLATLRDSNRETALHALAGKSITSSYLVNQNWQGMLQRIFSYWVNQNRLQIVNFFSLCKFTKLLRPSACPCLLMLLSQSKFYISFHKYIWSWFRKWNQIWKVSLDLSNVFFQF